MFAFFRLVSPSVVLVFNLLIDLDFEGSDMRFLLINQTLFCLDGFLLVPAGFFQSFHIFFFSLQVFLSAAVL